MKYLFINEDQAYKDWSETITEATGVKNPSKLKWMSNMLQINATAERNSQSLNESHAIPGMGPVAFPSDPGTGVGAKQGAFFQPDYKVGSGDIPSAKLAIAMNVAAYTAGFELAPTIPMELPSTMFSYLDSVYAGGTLDSSEAAPIYIEIGGGDIGTAALVYPTVGSTFVVFSADSDDEAIAGPAVEVTFIKKHHFNGNLIVKVVGTGEVAATTGGSNLAFTPSSDYSVSDVFTFAGDHIAIAENGTAAASGTPLGGSGSIVKAKLVSTLESNVPEFSRNDAPVDVDATATGSYRMSRAQAEKGTSNAIGLRLFSTAVEAGEIEVIANITKTQLKDLAAYNIDGVRQIYSAAQNQLTQTINADILRDIFRLGVTCHANLKQAQGLDLNLYIGDVSTPTKALSSFGLAEFKDITGKDRSSDFPAVKNAETATAGENIGTRQRRIASRILAAANIISNVGKHGKGDFVVVNSQIASALQDVKMFSSYGFENDLSVSTKNLYSIGTIQGGVAVYCDPNMGWNDTRVAVGRVGTDEDPGLKIFVYDLASSIEAIDTNTMSPKISVTSRYTLLHAGWSPETQYLTFGLNADNGWI